MKFIYLLYLIRKTKLKKLFAFIHHVKKLKKTNSFSIFFRMLYCFIKYNTAFLDYFFLEFYNKEKEEIATYSDTLFMYRFQSKLNDGDSISFFSDKKKFYKKFENYINHEIFLPNQNNIDDFKTWLGIQTPKSIIVKYSEGQVGSGLQKFQIKEENGIYLFNDNTLDDFYKKLIEQKLDIIEVNIEQHPVLKSFHLDSLNTIRVITVLNQHERVNILGTILRMGVQGNFIDNFDAGGVSAVVNTETGVVEGPILYKDPRKKIERALLHPTTNAQVLGVALPFWNELINLVKELAMVMPQVKTVGWDIAITEKGPVLLEGNHNWDKTHWQKSYGKGMKSVLKSYQ
ncbi:hypothetical protein GTQ40_14785 [Flavobacteriaceae bacterium R38]|nr:hypothetical protein [Flavobacteriaceae bacterium R38]